MNVLITGATGFLGSHLCRRLSHEGHAITILRRVTSNVEALKQLDLTHKIGEITDSQSVERAIQGQQVVIHTAAWIPNSGRTKKLLYDINVGGTRNVVESCLRNGVQRLLHVSSVAAIGIPDDPAHPANEDFRFNLQRSELHYHRSKQEAESVVAEGVARGLDAVIVNPSGICGPAGTSYRGIDLIRRVGHSRILRCPPGGVCVVHIQDVVEGLLAGLERGVTGNRYILGGDNLTFREMMKKTADAIGVTRWFVPIPGSAMKVLAFVSRAWSSFGEKRVSMEYARYYCASRCSFYDSSKARLVLGFRARPFEAILEECARFIGSPSL